MAIGKVFVFRLGHRIGRDERASAHLLLAARALGAMGVYYSGERDSGLERSIQRVVERWGGKFFVSYVEDWEDFLEEWKKRRRIAHLTMYGERLQDALPGIKKVGKGLLVVVGGAKVPGEVFRLADFNVSVGSQPHSEIAALAVFLDRVFEGKWEGKGFAGAKIRVRPDKMGKSIFECK